MIPTKKWPVLLIVLLALTNNVFSQEWWFWPRYTLGQKAENYPGPRIDAPVAIPSTIQPQSLPLTFHGQDPTQRITNFFESAFVPAGHFTVELWMVNHVNHGIGSLITYKSRYDYSEPNFLLGMYGPEIIFTLKGTDAGFADIITHKMTKRGFKKYFVHVAATYDGKAMALYVNGERVAELPHSGRQKVDAGQYELEAASYMSNEPYMGLGNHLKMISLEDRALSQQQIFGRYQTLQRMVEEGKLFPGLFHFNAGPYLNNVTATSIDIVWETDRPSDFVVSYGQQLPLDKKVEIHPESIRREGEPTPGNIYKVTLKDLEPGAAYFYNIAAVSKDGSTMESGVLTFATQANDAQSYSFGVIGDTEARPHINDRIAKLLWDERPNFILLVGDLTDGGVKDHKFEWNYEYFQGMTQIASRVPVFPVPGNGEDDLHWYNQYHSLPGNGYYSFRYGNAEFFMLDSNQPKEFAPGGKQYEWLEKKLKASTAKWKFVCHHHAPYSADDDDYGDAWKGKSASGDMAVRAIVPLYEKYKVDMVFFGHLHTYQRTLPIRDNLVDEKNGVIYVQGGGGGGNLEDFAPSRAWFSAKTYRGHHYFTVTVNGGNLNFKMYDTEGRLKDYLDLKKE